MIRRRKDYRQVIDSENNVINFIPSADSGWRFHIDDKVHDLRRWLYVGRPVIDQRGENVELLHDAGRAPFVVSVRDALWRLKSKGATGATLTNYVAAGMNAWFRFHDYLFESGRTLQSAQQINQALIEQYIAWLRKTPGKHGSRPLSYTSAKAIYAFTKSVFKEIARADEAKLAIFPPNPFPGADRAYVGAAPLDQRELKQVMAALGQDLKLVRSYDPSLSSADSAAVYFLLVAARTGRNLTPLLEMSIDAVEPHPLREDMGVLKLYKRRGSKILRQGFNTQALQSESGNATTDVISLIREFVEKTAALREENQRLADAVWIYRHPRNSEIRVFNARSLSDAIARFCSRHDLSSAGKRGAVISVGRFRKTFAMHMWHLSKGDLARTAAMMGNRPTVTDTHYLSVTPDMVRQHKFVGHILAATITGNVFSAEFVSSLASQLSVSQERAIEIIGGRTNTGVARCSDYLGGRFAPRNGTDVCTRFLHCFRCPNQVVMESDLHRLFSFYWLLLKERKLLGRSRWKAAYSWVIRVIDRDIAPHFDSAAVTGAKDRARHDPHPMWQDRSMLVGGKPL